jgi:hypothetical protein
MGIRRRRVSKYLEPKTALFPWLFFIGSAGLGLQCFEIRNRRRGEHPAGAANEHLCSPAAVHFFPIRHRNCAQGLGVAFL